MQDAYLKATTIACTNKPQTVAYLALHQDYSHKPVVSTELSEEECGQLVIDRCLKFGHWGVLEHASILINCSYVPHSTMQQWTRHRLLSFDVQSFRYTSQGILEATKDEHIERLFYLRQPGEYVDRQGKRYVYSEEQRHEDLQDIWLSVGRYRERVLDLGWSEEHARDLLPSCYRQHFQMSGNLRTFLHVINLRAKKNAQLESQMLANEVIKCLDNWAPGIIQWYQTNYKGHIAP